jgi:hypothetical protein
LDHLQICIAIAALAVHVPVEDWGAGGIVNWLSDEMKAHPEFIPGFLELLIVLPQVLICYSSYLLKTDTPMLSKTMFGHPFFCKGAYVRRISFARKGLYHFLFFKTKIHS